MAKKSLGQHFLKDKEVVRWIIGQIPSQTGTVIEIGPGKGALTNYLDAQKSVLFEMDDEFVNEWRAKGFTVHAGDAVKILKNHIPTIAATYPGPLTVISNLPYNASTQIFVELMKLRIPKLVLMFQKEVAEKIAAAYGEREFGRLSILSKIFYKVVKTKSAAPKAFSPPPKIWSLVLSMDLLPKPLIDDIEFERLEEIIKKCFQFPRKKIRAVGVNLAHLQDKRPHELTQDEWIEVIRSLN